MGLKSRTKGKAGEREIAAIIRDLTGWDIKRKVRQREGESDLEGVEGWCIEVKRHKTATRAEIRAWWGQAERQAMVATGMQKPVLFYRKDRDDWRAVWELYPQEQDTIVLFPAYLWTVEGSIEAWCDVARGMMPKTGKVPMSYQEGDK
jgi:hypothetical protein